MTRLHHVVIELTTYGRNERYYMNLKKRITENHIEYLKTTLSSVVLRLYNVCLWFHLIASPVLPELKNNNFEIT